MHNLVYNLLHVVFSKETPPKDKLVQVKTILQKIRGRKETINIDEWPPQYGRSALITAAILPGHENILRELIRAKADVNLPSGTNKTALMYAAADGHTANVDVLLRAGANPDAKGGPLGQTALIYAVLSGELDTLKLLLRAGADLDVTDAQGKTALDYAIEKNNFDIVYGLLQFDAKIGDIPALRAFLDSQQGQEGTTKICRGICYRQEGNEKEAENLYYELLYPDEEEYSQNLVIERAALNRLMRAYFLGESFRDPDDRNAWMDRAEAEVGLSQFLDEMYALDKPERSFLFSQPGSSVMFPPPIRQTAMHNKTVTTTEKDESKPDFFVESEHDEIVDESFSHNRTLPGKYGK